ncbi:hypothetical protein [Thermococcus peptonophilus]|uniref:hypothetical protein n=1 Tax=Thermococcus peptonophilus TaxID=53952 RepID=UPI000A640463
MVKVGETVPDFEADAYFPEKDDIGKLKFSDYRGQVGCFGVLSCGLHLCLPDGA